MNPIFTAELQRVEPQRVVLQDLLLAAVGEGRARNRSIAFGYFEIAVLIVGGGDEVVVAERIDDVGDELFVALGRAKLLRAKILRGRHRQMCQALSCAAVPR
jgi:hypothetical protein